MAAIRGKNTRPEITVRRILHGLGYRFRLHSAALPGKPDIVLPKHKCVVFVNGCFWHQHSQAVCPLSRRPKSRLEYWGPKLERNRKRDTENQRKLRRIGWRVLVIWECQIARPESVILRLNNFLGKKA